MKKVFTLLTLALLSIGTAWGGDLNTTLISGITLPSTPTGTYTGGTSVLHKDDKYAVVVDGSNNGLMQASAPGYGSPTGDFTWANATDGSDDATWPTTGASWEAPSGSVFIGSTPYNTAENAHNISFARKCNIRNVRTFAYRFTNCEGVSALVKSQGKTDEAAAVLAVYRVDGSNLITAGSASSKTNAVDVITVDGLTKTQTYVAFVYGMNGSNGELYEIAFLAPTSDPFINAANTSIKTTTSGADETEDIVVTGANLTANGTLTATLSPAVTGLSVALASNSIDAEGAISTTATLTYNATANAKGTTTLTLSDGTTSKEVTITYNASVVAWTLQSVSSATTWDWSKVAPNSLHSLYKNNGIALTADSDPDYNTEFVMENYADGNLYTIADGFDGTTVSFKGEYPCRNSQFCQNGTVKFNTTVPGKIVVKFSDTGTSASATAVKRYLKVNGENTEYWTSRENNGTDNPYSAQLNVVSGEITVPAGDVTITGSSAIQIYYITFTPVIPEPADPTTSGDYVYLTTSANMQGWRTFFDETQAYTVDENTTVYVAQTSAGKINVVSFTGGIPANTPVILHTSSSADSYKMTLTKVAALDLSVPTNILRATTAETDLSAGTYRLGYKSTNGVGFYSYSSATAPAGIVYILKSDVTGGGAPGFLDFFIADDNTEGGEATGIDAVEKAQKADGVYYNVNGQRVAQPTKGLYIVNGKKVIVK